ncbi:MAG: RNA polymerase factor sigma-54 [Verrucomicrobiia bacterium]|jgi:RNA polymerase sigma-54 factor
MPTQALQQIQKLGLQQVLSPQMQQSLQILQAPTLELTALVRQELDANPVLEELPDEETEDGEVPGEPVEAEEPADDLEAIAQLDQEWREYFSQAAAAAPRANAEEEERRQTFFDSISRPETLSEHLLAQLSLAEVAELLRPVCENIIGNLDERGYLTATDEELLAWAGGRREVADQALATVQSLDPVGVSARDLRECLLLQLRRLGHGADSAAARVVRSHIEDLASRRFAEIAGALGVRVEEIQRAAGVIATLDPNPGRRFAAGEDRFVVPDLAVQKVGDEWGVLQNDDSVPHLRIGNAYKDLLGETGQTKEVREYVRERIRAAKFLIKSIHQRQDTILRIAREIVRVQRDFLENGREFLKPLTMAEMAGLMGVHETTVGRAVSGKYMQTPHGIFELKWFFTPGVKMADGGMISPDRIKAAISELVGDESEGKPLADQDLAEALKGRGMAIARRTVAKYREELGILPSHARKTRKEA